MESLLSRHGRLYLVTIALLRHDIGTCLAIWLQVFGGEDAGLKNEDVLKM
jgi:hypothetical protein